MSTGWSPFLSSSTADAEQNDEYLGRELDYWGPGRFSRALRAGVRQGRLSHPRRGYYGPPDA